MEVGRETCQNPRKYKATLWRIGTACEGEGQTLGKSSSSITVETNLSRYWRLFSEFARRGVNVKLMCNVFNFELKTTRHTHRHFPAKCLPSSLLKVDYALFGVTSGTCVKTARAIHPRLYKLLILGC